MSRWQPVAQAVSALLAGALFSCAGEKPGDAGHAGSSGPPAAGNAAVPHGGSGGSGAGSNGTAAGQPGTGGSPGTAGDQNGGSGGSVHPSAGAPAGGSSGVQPGPITCRASGDGKSTITLVNQCMGTLSFRGSAIEGGELGPGEHACRDVGSDVESIPAIRYWGFIGPDPGGEKHTLAELTLNTDFNDFDWYNISHVDAHNLPMRVQPVDMASCRVLTCAESLLAGCPAEGQLKDEAGNLISCFSPNRDDPNSAVAQYFEASCEDAYSWSGDDSESVAACAGEDYDVVFCP